MDRIPWNWVNCSNLHSKSVATSGWEFSPSFCKWDPFINRNEIQGTEERQQYLFEECQVFSNLCLNNRVNCIEVILFQDWPHIPFAWQPTTLRGPGGGGGNKATPTPGGMTCRESYAQMGTMVEHSTPFPYACTNFSLQVWQLVKRKKTQTFFFLNYHYTSLFYH